MDFNNGLNTGNLIHPSRSSFSYYQKNRRPLEVPRGKFLRKIPGGNGSTDIINELKNLNLGDRLNHEVQTFEDMNLSVEILKGISDMGYEKPALCQKKIVLPIIKGKDVVCQAQSGMGKTAAYAIGILKKINLGQPKSVQALILTPTRELAEQAAEVFASLGKHMKGLRIHTSIGGTDMKKDIASLLFEPQIIIGTCGRIAHHFEDHRIDPSTIQTLVLDEADKMITDPGFRTDLQYLIYSIPGDSQFILASATMPQPILDKCKIEFLRNPLLVLIPNEELTLQGIRQYYVMVDTPEQKIDNLADIFPSMGKKKGLIFCNTRSQAENLNKKLQIVLNDSKVAGMVGTMEQYSRKSTLDNFRSGIVNYLVSSDLLGRGIDVQQVEVVVNFELPSKIEEYIHRVGRAGRFGRKGVAITFVLTKPADEKKLAQLQEFYRTRIDVLPNRLGDVFNI